MPESKWRKTPERNRQDVAAHRARKREVIDELLEGVIIRISPTTANGNGRITYDMDRATNDALVIAAAEMGQTLDQLLQANIRRTVGKIADLRRRAEKERNAADLERVGTGAGHHRTGRPPRREGEVMPGDDRVQDELDLFERPEYVASRQQERRMKEQARIDLEDGILFHEGMLAQIRQLLADMDAKEPEQD